VLAALAILATLLSAVLLTKQRAARQWRSADERIEAAAIADELLTQWWAGGQIALPGRGYVSDHDHWQWQTFAVQSPAAQALGTQIAELRIIDAETPKKPRLLIAVQVLVSLPPEDRNPPDDEQQPDAEQPQFDVQAAPDRQEILNEIE
jgi:hypothetical protein